ncbi:MAG: FtsQ-type POTRA domain-containing protein [Armatimonadetes bacterium]|nr:FtsQ-type POTRA domain-containing protein [Akkermansiaceae bacterium]
MRKRTSKSRHHRYQVKVLKSEVMSPRIAWFSVLNFLRLLAKAAVAIGIILAIAYGIREAIEHTFHQNPDFRLQAINLNPNDVLDEADLVEHLKIDLAANIFDFDISDLEKQILKIPAIASARVERNLPGAIDFKIQTRKPAAWIACPEAGFPASRIENALLVDHDGYTYPCPLRQVRTARELPIITLAADPEYPITAGSTLAHPQYKNCLHLLKAVVSEYPDDLPLIESISQENDWSLKMTIRTGTIATFGLGDHSRQLAYLNRALYHAQGKGYEIATINLIPKLNVPITVSGKNEPPRAIPVAEPSQTEIRQSRQSDDLKSLLNRN